MAKETQSGTNGTTNSTSSNSGTTNVNPPKDKPVVPGRILSGQVRMESVDPEFLITKEKLED